MKILFYTSPFLGPYNEYNISQVLTKLPDEDYLSVAVGQKQRRATRRQRHPGNWLVRKIWSKRKRWRGHPSSADINGNKSQLAEDNAVLCAKIGEMVSLRCDDRMPVVEVGQVNDEQSENAIRQFQPDVIVQSGAGILKPNIFGLSRLATLNVHHGFAPEIRGMQSTLWCLYYGLTDLIGVTCHHIDETLDTGAVVGQYRHRYQPGDNYIDIQIELVVNGAELLVEALSQAERTARYTCREVISHYFSKFPSRQYDALAERRFSAVRTREELQGKRTLKQARSV